MNQSRLAGEEKDLEFIKKFDKGKTWLIPTRNGEMAFQAAYNPGTVSGKEATFMRDEDRVIGITVRGHSRAYPYYMCDKHHTVNDTLGGEHVLITD